MPANLGAILKLEVPLIVLLGQRQMSVQDVMNLAPGMIIELPKQADEELELLVNNKVIGVGRAVKVGENFGVRVSFVGDIRRRIIAMGQVKSDLSDPVTVALAIAEAMLSGEA